MPAAIPLMISMRERDRTGGPIASPALCESVVFTIGGTRMDGIPVTTVGASAGVGAGPAAATPETAGDTVAIGSVTGASEVMNRPSSRRSSSMLAGRAAGSFSMHRSTSASNAVDTGTRLEGRGGASNST